MNVNRNGVLPVARQIFQKIVAQGFRLTVAVKPNGAVIVRRDRPDRGQAPLPDEWLVGRYNWKCPYQDIADDLQARVDEIRLSGSSR